ncbi:hypothetical protein ACHAQA_001810 [Verticillium albo-atrum]
MTVPVSHYERPGTSGTGPQVKSEFDDLAYSAVQFSVDSLDADLDADMMGKDSGSAAGGDMGMDWGSVVAAEDLRFDDFLDLDSMSHTGDEWADHDQPDSLFFDMPALDGSTSATSVSDDLDDLLSCHSQQQLQHRVPPMEARASTTAGPAATSCMAAGSRGGVSGGGGGGVGGGGGGGVVGGRAGASRFPSAHQDSPAAAPVPPGRSQPSPAIARGGVGGRGGGARVPGGQRKTASTYPDTALGLGGPESISDSELLRLEGISLKASPSRVPPLGHVSHSQPPTPLLHQGQGPATSKATTTTTTASAAASTTTTGSRSFFKAVASKIQKAATVRSKPSFSRTTINTIEHDPSTMSSLSIDRPISPAVSPRKAFKLRPDQQQMGIPEGPHHQQRLPISPPNSATIPQGLSNPFCNGFVEDPFGFDPSLASGPSPGMYKRQTPHTPIDTPVLDDDKGNMYFQQPIQSHHNGGVAQGSKAAWPLPSSSAQSDSHGSIAWSNSFAQSDGLDTTQWWDGSVDLNDASSHFQAQNARNATYNLALHTQQAAASAGRDMAYEYHNQGQQHVPASGNPHEMSGLMIQMSQASRASSSPVVPGAGTRHMATPLRRQRPSSANRSRARDSSSASPTPNGRSRNSSGSSNAGGPVIGASVKKRRSFQTPAGGRPGHPRTPSGGSSGALGLGIGMGDGGGGGGGFVNFTPSDHTLLMTGVAPSGSSKTKARREKEALEKRRRMSEAALKAVAAAGGDIDKLVEEGFVF